MISWNYVEELFDVDVMEAMFSQFVDLLEQLVKQRDVTSLQVKKSDQTLIEQYNQTTEKYLPLRCINCLQTKYNVH